MNKSAEKIKLTSFDDLFGTASLDSGERVTTVPQCHLVKTLSRCIPIRQR